MNSKLIKSALAYISSSVFVQGIAFISQIILLRWLSVVEYGGYALAFEVFAICNLLINGAFRNFYLKAIRFGMSLDKLLSYQLIFGSFWCTLSVVCTSIIFKLDIKIAFMMCFSMMMSSLFLPVSMEFLAKGKKWRLIVRDCLNALSVLVVTYLLVLNGQKESQIFVMFVLFSQVLVNIIVFSGHVKIKEYFTVSNCNKIGFSIIPFFGVFIVNTLYNKLGVLYVNLTMGIESVALYLAAFKFITPFYAIQAALISAIMPKFTSSDTFEFNKRFFLFFALPGGFFSVALCILFPFVIDFLGLEKYNGLYNIIIYSSPIIFVVFLYGSLSNYIAVNGGQKYIIITNMLGVVIYVLMLFISRLLYGLNGVLISSISFFVITECMVCALYYFKIKKRYEISIFFLVSPFLVIIYEFYLLLNK